MKSNKEILKQRGYYEKQEAQAYASLPDNALWMMANANDAHLASIAIYILYQRDFLHYETYVDFLIAKLYTEKHLYTKLTICDVFANGDELIARKLMHHLGNIGHNQYREVGKPSHKKSYPIARDMVARTMCHMQISSKVLLELFALDDKQCREAIDVVGYQLFYHNDLDQKPFLSHIKLILKTTRDEVLIWKCLTCLSGFYLLEARLILESYVYSNNHIFKEEATRSLRLMKERQSL